MKNKYFILLIFILTINLYSQKKLNFEFDYAQFAYDSTSNYVEFYFSFDQNNLTLQKGDSINFNAGRILVQIKDSLNNFIVNKQFRAQSPYREDIESKLLITKMSFALKPGVYNVHIVGKDDIDTLKTKTIDEKIKVNLFLTNEFRISDIELARTIKTENVNPNSVFYKNTIEVIPNPAILYSSGTPVAYYYAELYNLSNLNLKEDYTLIRYLYNSKGKEINKKTKQVKRDKNSIVEVGLINMIKYPTDTYNLVLALIDSVNNKVVFSNKRFYYYNPSFKDTTIATVNQEGYLSSEFAVYTEEECDDIFEKSRYIATSREIEQYKKLESVETKRDFLYKFWKMRDLEPETEKFEFKDKYFNGVEYCNIKYSTFNKKGYKTDRGRVYLLYGEPDQVDMYPNETNMKPYEIWYYNRIEGGVLFIFGDLTGYNDYELLSSTKRGEIRDDNWQRRITTN
jgi:GWxTD domain-containing protein